MFAIVMPARPPWMAEVLETQEQFPVKAGIQEGQLNHWIPAFAGMTKKWKGVLALIFPKYAPRCCAGAPRNE